MLKDLTFYLKRRRVKLISLFLGSRKKERGISCRVPFEYAHIPGIGRLVDPIVRFNIKTIAGWQEFEFLVDTGADITTVPVHLLPVLGLKKSELSINSTLGIGGYSIKTWDFKMDLKLGKIEFSVYTSAIETEDSSIPLLLGRKDIFEEKFNLLLDSKRKVTIVSENT